MRREKDHRVEACTNGGEKIRLGKGRWTSICRGRERKGDQLSSQTKEQKNFKTSNV